MLFGSLQELLEEARLADARRSELNHGASMALLDGASERLSQAMQLLDAPEKVRARHALWGQRAHARLASVGGVVPDCDMGARQLRDRPMNCQWSDRVRLVRVTCARVPRVV